MTKKYVMVSALSLLALVSVASAREHGPGGREPGDHGPLFRGNSCIAACQVTALACHQAAGTEARTCAQTTCSADLQAAQDACATDRRSDACEAAQAAARLCLTPCIDALTTAKAGCRTDNQTCVVACPTPTPSTSSSGKDPQCIAQCRTDLHACREKASADDQTCDQTCDALIQAARTACGADATSSDCQAAISVAHACLQPCRTARRTALQACMSTAHDCVQTCVIATPTPTP